MTGTGNHVFLGWEIADQYEKMIVGSCNRKSRVLGWETAEQVERRIVGSGWSKTTEKTRAQSPKSNWSSGGRYKKATTRG